MKVKITEANRRAINVLLGEINGKSGGNVPSAYKYSRIVNTYTIERGSSEWFLIAANKIDNWGNAGKDQLSLTPAQRDIAVSKFTAQFSVQKVVELAVAA